MDDERIKRIARAMCRAARLDPDKPADGAQLRRLALAEPPTDRGNSPAWILFRRNAERFAAAHREIASAL
ncbi:hypothetical protein [Bosea sp. PAMC 26642]|uniref:hypothetical protein n=1 Tax=Bosea sp. (strain PAMC 26642) TaxID=1792307 RepID=UPI000A8A0250|nr:hypothetical protein [Bosea sp. PAMC 26642]